ncbi:MAG: SPOR domain-containing protein [Saprospiraceae bacterium]|nr:SPOR domain-containing protein [Saprospiraceae bacterium]
MPTNKLLTYALFAVLFTLLAVAGYKACQMQKEAQMQAEELAELDQALRDMGYPLEDTTAGSAYTGGDVDYNAPATAGNDKSADNPYDQPAAGAASAYDQPAAAAPPQTTAPKTATSNAGRVVDYSSESEPSDGRYRVVAGSFRVKDNARRQMEKIIRMGYQSAEVGLYNRGAYAVVIVKRTNDLNEANRILDALEDKGIDAAVIDRTRK